MTRTTIRPGLTRRLRLLGALGALGLTAACSTLPSSPLQPVIPPVTPTSSELRELPPPTDKVTVAVYDFPDLTGQYKERDNIQSLSRAVTQGAATMLIKSLQEAGERRWFTVLERTDFDDLLRERQIITEMRRLYRGEERINASVIPPLLHAGIILQGGIIGYDTNTITSGAGLRILGTGGDGKYQQDTVTVNLRAISTKTGEVLLNVTARKSILSAALQGGAFRYLQVDKILEAEAGVTTNEPRQIAVQAAIDEAVRALIVEGSDLDLWHFRDREAQEALIVEYKTRQFPRREVPDGALNPPSPVTNDPSDVTQTTAFQPRRTIFGTPRVTTRQTQPAAQPAAVREVRPGGTPRNVGPSGTPASAIRQEAPVQQNPAPAAPALPPAPTADEPAVGAAPDGGAPARADTNPAFSPDLAALPAALPIERPARTAPPVAVAEAVSQPDIAATFALFEASAAPTGSAATGFAATELAPAGTLAVADAGLFDGARPTPAEASRTDETPEDAAPSTSRVYALASR